MGGGDAAAAGGEIARSALARGRPISSPYGCDGSGGGALSAAAAAAAAVAALAIEKLEKELRGVDRWPCFVTRAAGGGERASDDWCSVGGACGGGVARAGDAELR